MNSLATVRAAVRSRLALIVAGLFVLLGPFVVTAPAQAGYYGGYYGGYNPCYYRCGYRPYYRPYRRCCGSGVVYERRYIEREFVERRYAFGGYGGYRRPWGYPYYRRPCGYSPCGGYYRPPGYGGYGYGYGGVGRRWPLPYVNASGPYAEGYDEPPRPPEPVYDQGEY
jgi:hypothetical protein